MTVTATAPKARTRSSKTSTPANPAVTPEQAAELAIQKRLEELKTAYVAAKTGEAGTKKLLKSAKEAWENSRVITSRLAYAVAMLKPNEKGEANLSYAARELVMTAESLALTGEAYKAKQKAANSTLRNYVAAGAALQEAGHNPRGEGDKGNTSEPTADERKVVADAFKEGNKRGTNGNTAGGTGGEGEGEGGESNAPAPVNGAALSVADLLEHVSRLQATLALMVKASVPVTEEQAQTVSMTLETFMEELTAYATA